MGPALDLSCFVHIRQNSRPRST